jgi:hypothetical protein
MCCGPGQYIPAGGTSCVCANGGTWDSAIEECVLPTPTCPRPLVYCDATSSCTSLLACNGRVGGCKGTTCM